MACESCPRSLKTSDLAHLRLSCTLPDTLASLKRLVGLSTDMNALSGKLPDAMVFWTGLTILMFGEDLSIAKFYPSAEGENNLIIGERRRKSTENVFCLPILGSIFL